MGARARSGGALAATALAWACTPDAAVGAGPGRVPEGTWGGAGARLEVTAEGARLELGCAHGAMGPLELDREARFEVEGTYTRERPGPDTPSSEPATEPAFYRGRLEGEVLTFHAELEGGDVVGPFEVVHGRSGRVVKCL